MEYDELHIPANLKLARRLFEDSRKRFFAFMSYTTREVESSETRNVVSRVCAELESHSLPTWKSPVFHDGIFDVGGRNLHSNIEAALSDSVIVSAYISPLYFDSPYCRWESEYGLRHQALHWLMWKPVPHFESTHVSGVRGRDISQCAILEASKLALADTLCTGIRVLQREGH